MTGGFFSPVRPPTPKIRGRAQSGLYIRFIDRRAVRRGGARQRFSYAVALHSRQYAHADHNYRVARGPRHKHDTRSPLFTLLIFFFFFFLRFPPPPRFYQTKISRGARAIYVRQKIARARSPPPTLPSRSLAVPNTTRIHICIYLDTDIFWW